MRVWTLILRWRRFVIAAAFGGLGVWAALQGKGDAASTAFFAIACLSVLLGLYDVWLRHLRSRRGS